jgi:hypothetical protein
MPEQFTIGGTRLFVNAGTQDRKVLRNTGADTLYYGDNTVTSVSFTGSVLAGAAVTLVTPYWLISAGTSRVLVDSDTGPLPVTAAQPGTSTTVGTSSVTLIAANAVRKEAHIVNDHASNIVYLKYGATAVANQGIRLNPNGGTHKVTGYAGVVAAIASGASTSVSWTEV